MTKCALCLAVACLFLTTPARAGRLPAHRVDPSLVEKAKEDFASVKTILQQLRAQHASFKQRTLGTPTGRASVDQKRPGADLDGEELLAMALRANKEWATERDARDSAAAKNPLLKERLHKALSRAVQRSGNDYERLMDIDDKITSFLLSDAPGVPEQVFQLTSIERQIFDLEAGELVLAAVDAGEKLTSDLLSAASIQVLTSMGVKLLPGG